MCVFFSSRQHENAEDAGERWTLRWLTVSVSVRCVNSVDILVPWYLGSAHFCQFVYIWCILVIMGCSSFIQVWYSHNEFIMDNKLFYVKPTVIQCNHLNLQSITVTSKLWNWNVKILDTWKHSFSCSYKAVDLCNQ